MAVGPRARPRAAGARGGHYYVGALPGVIVALALVTITVRVALPLYQTVATLLLAYLLMFLPRALVGSARQHRPGAGRTRARGGEPGPPPAGAVMADDDAARRARRGGECRAGGARASPTS